MKNRKSTFKGFRGIGKPKREWTPGPVIDLNPAFNKRVAAARALRAEMDAKRAGVRSEDGVTA